MEMELLQNNTLSWKQAQKNNTVFGIEIWLFKVFTEEEV